MYNNYNYMQSVQVFDTCYLHAQQLQLYTLSASVQYFFSMHGEYKTLLSLTYLFPFQWNYEEQLQLKTLSASLPFWLFICMVNVALFFLPKWLNCFFLSETMKNAISCFLLLCIW